MQESAVVGQNSELQAQIVMSPDIDFVWPMAMPLLAKATVRFNNKMELEDIYHAIKRDVMQLWVIHDGEDVLVVGVTELIDYYNSRSCRCLVLGGGGYPDFIPMLKEVEQWAISEGCEHMEVVGRRGWVRALKDDGYDEFAAIIGKRLNRERLN